MRALRAFLLILAATIPLAAQAPPHSFLAYVHVLENNPAKPNQSNSCVIVGDDGQFRYEVTPSSEERVPSNTKVYLGHLNAPALQRLKQLLAAPELSGLRSSEPRGSLLDTYRLEVSLRIHRRDQTQELVMIADRPRNLPPSVWRFVPWMEDLRKTFGPPNKGVLPRHCSSLDVTPDFQPGLQKR
jgi:hypothetical protein